MTPPDGIAAAFAAPLLDPALPPPIGLVARNGGPVTKRYGVYRNNVVVGLVDALQKRFNVCARLVGDAFFRAMAAVYVRRAPPVSPILAEYGEDFGDFIATFEPAREVAYLPDVARLEYAMGRAYHAADQDPLPLEAIAAIAPDRLHGVAIALHPSLQLVASLYPIASIWRTNILDAEPAGVDLGSGEDVLVVRPRLEVELHVLPPGGLRFLQALEASKTLGPAAAAGAAADPDFDLTACLGLLLRSEAIVAAA